MKESICEDIDKFLAIHKTETNNFDYKETFNWDDASTDKKCEIIKDILAMANTRDGGKIIFGIRDEDYELVGMEEADWKSFDQTKINDFLHKYTDPKFPCQVHKCKVDEKYVAIIDVPEFKEIPIICKKDANFSDNHKSILREGQIYIRTEKASSETISSAEDMRKFLGMAIKKRAMNCSIASQDCSGGRL